MAKKVQREQLAAKAPVVEESVSSFHIEDDEAPQLDQREVAHTSSALSLGNGGYRTLPSFCE